MVRMSLCLLLRLPVCLVLYCPLGCLSASHSYSCSGHAHILLCRLWSHHHRACGKYVNTREPQNTESYVPIYLDSFTCCTQKRMPSYPQTKSYTRLWTPTQTLRHSYIHNYHAVHSLWRFCEPALTIGGKKYSCSEEYYHSQKVATVSQHTDHRYAYKCPHTFDLHSRAHWWSTCFPPLLYVTA